MHSEGSVMLSITGENGDGEQITLETHGRLTDIGSEHWELQYEETEAGGFDSTRTVVTCDAGSVTVSRKGAVVSTIVYRANETFVGAYQTPVGRMTLRVFTTEVSAKRRGWMGHIHLTYQLSLSTALSPVGETMMRHLDIRFRPRRGQE